MAGCWWVARSVTATAAPLALEQYSGGLTRLTGACPVPSRAGWIALVLDLFVGLEWTGD